MNNFQVARRMARILGTTIARCEEMLRAGNDAGLSTVYMDACVRAYARPKRRRKAYALLREIGDA